jgi:hypothetical protein
MSVLGAYLAKRFNNQQDFTDSQKRQISEGINRGIPYMFKKFDRSVNEKNPDGVYATRHRCEETGRNMPTIADYQLFCEFIDFKYFKNGEFDNFDWESLYPRLKIWHDTLWLDQDDFALKHSLGLREV